MKSKKVVKLTESDLERIIKRVLNEQPTGEVESLNDCISKKQIRDNVDVSFSPSCKAAFQKLDNGKIDQKALYACATDMKFEGTPNYRYFGGELDKCLKKDINEQVQPKEEVEAVNACRRKFELQIPQSCLAPFKQLDNGEMPDKESIYTCGKDVIVAEGLEGNGFEFVKCIMNALGKHNPMVRY
jgi:hypothetical protein